MFKFLFTNSPFRGLKYFVNSDFKLSNVLMYKYIVGMSVAGHHVLGYKFTNQNYKINDMSFSHSFALSIPRSISQFSSLPPDIIELPMLINCAARRFISKCHFQGDMSTMFADIVLHIIKKARFDHSVSSQTQTVTC